ncbi:MULTISPECIES: hypothetical protein [Bradyrhizobium]|uniref:hypothetical protein n=1 Tax=Bradyrhizobium TaxID=374 RepID=UPI00155E87F6|nr:MULTISPECIES: hypothetical protein [Bradyrhizobium]MDD1522424.1 hypothetical protein [Bradyrhizobium sp. WBAH30]MDD1546348.1 hypothetical protein [Bradyrhizobium sp. WBAH41]MDD1560512.1 hypothetical protein [Bradyrhizobium sp. WBAH23]MDD1567355.1 hypothetical protein [Bradyrhizobium sp. WBAH33]MDD1594165.1 hypothetical protein [Bradyrhizobium sp. WBAH42]
MSYTEALARLRKAVTKRLITLDVINLDADLLPDFFPNCQNFGAEIYVTKQKRGCFHRACIGHSYAQMAIQRQTSKALEREATALLRREPGKWQHHAMRSLAA